MSDFGEGKIVSARKAYTCEWCANPIPVGERHFQFIGKWQGEFQNWRMHPDCEDAHQRETYEGEICEATHWRGTTCGEKEDAIRAHAKEMAEMMEEDAAQKRPWFSIALAVVNMTLDFMEDAPTEAQTTHSAKEKE